MFMASLFDHFRRDGRYRFRRGDSLDPNDGLHPEMVDQSVDIGTGVPNTFDELMAMQENNPANPGQPQKPDRSEKTTAKVKQVLDLIKELETSAAEDLEIALTLVRQLEDYHDKVVAEMQDDPDAKHGQIAAWSVDADRLMHCRIFLNSIEFE
jgi:hypothetical protein